MYEGVGWRCVCACKHVLLHAYWGVNPGLGARCWWQSKSRRRRASKTAGGEAHCRFENVEVKKEEETREKTGRSVITEPPHCQPHLSSPPLTFTVWHLMPKETSAGDKENLSPFFCYFILQFSQRASHPPHKLNITPLYNIRLVKSLYPCLILSIFF